MTCSWVKIDGNLVHINHKGPRLLPCVVCGEISVRLCDWKLEGGTCDAPLCEKHTNAPARGKDLCPEHARTWAKDPANPKSRQGDLDFGLNAVQ